MSRTTTKNVSRVAQQPTLPWEITDAIIDFLHHDTKTLSACSTVCSEWLIRSRYHSFSTVQLWPWRVRRFFQLANSRDCTFTKVIKRIEVDDSRERGRESDGRTKSEGSAHFSDAMAQSHIQCLAEVNSIQVRNVDWTTFSSSEQILLRGRLAKFSQLRRLEFDNIVFHDLREVARIVNSFPSLEHLTANIRFMKYPEHTLASAAEIGLSTSLRTIEIGTSDDAIPVVLTCITNERTPKNRILGMRLPNIKAKHLQYIHKMFKKSSKNLQNLFLAFTHENTPAADQDVLVNTLDLSHLHDLRTLAMEGFHISTRSKPSIINTILPDTLRRIESPFLESIALKFHLEDDADMSQVDWSGLQATLLELHFFGMKAVHVVIELGPSSPWKEENIEQCVCRSMSSLVQRGALDLHMVRDTRKAMDIGKSACV